MSYDPTDCPECSGFHPGVDCQAEDPPLPGDDEPWDGLREGEER